MVSTLVAYAVMEIGLSYAVATFAVNFALSYIVTRVFSDNPEKQQDMGVRQQVPPSAVNAIPVVYGDAYMGGTFVDAVLTTDQKTMYYVLAVSCISPDGQFTFDTTDMYYGDRLITFDGTDLTKVVSLTDEAGNVDTKINDNLYINLYKSNAAGTITSLNGAAAPSTVMGGVDIDAALRWTGTRQMNGLGFAIVKLVYNRDANTTQLSPITFKVSHYLNGAGVAKPGDVWYDYITNDVYGGAVPTTFVDSTSRTTLNTYSDQTITFTASGGSPSTQARYRINGVLDAGDSVLSNIDRIMSACDSWMTYNAALGQWSIVVNKAETAAYAFTDNNIVGDIRVSATDITSSINQVEARFPFKENRDQANFVNIETPSGLLYPNEPVNKYNITYDLVNDSVQATYLANRLLEQAREDLIVSFNTTYFGIQVDAGNVVSVTNSDYGWNAKLFRVMKVNEASLPDGTLGARLELNEYSAAVYDDQDITQYIPVPNSGLPSVSYFSPLSAATVTASNPTSAIPNFNVSVTVPASGRVTFVELYYTTAAIPAASDWQLLSTANTIDGTPLTPSSTYVFNNQVLPTGASTSATYYFSFIVGNEITQSTRSPISASFTWTPIAPVGPFVDISGFTSFSKSSSGVITPASVTLTAITSNVTSPTYAWSITGATPSSGTSSTITITPTSIATSVVATLVVNGSNLTSSITRQVTMAIIEQGTNGQSSRIMFARIAGNPTPIAGINYIAGDNKPSPAQSSSVWGASFFVTWYDSDPDPSSNNSLYQSDGVYNGTYTAWAAPYISSLKVGQLSAISANLGNITSGSITNTSANTTMQLGSTAGGTSSGATMYFERTGSASSALGPIIYGNDISTSKTSYSYAFSSNVGDTFIVYSSGVGGSYNGTFQLPATTTTFANLAVAGGTTGPAFLVSQQQYNGSSGNPVNPAGDFLALNGSGSVAARIKLASGTGYAYYIVSGVGGPFTGAHDGLVAKTETIAQGDIVVDGVLVRKASINDTLYVVTKSTTANQCALGVFNVSGPMVAASPPAALIDGYTDVLDDLGVTQYIPIPAPEFYVYEPTHLTSTVNSIGEGQINVCGENGNIAVGDLIVTSSMPGKGMKQSDDLIHSYTVAKAREAASFSSSTEVKMIACIYVSG